MLFFWILSKAVFSQENVPLSSSVERRPGAKLRHEQLAGQDRGSNPAKLLTLGPGALDPHFAVRQKVKRRRCRLSRRWRTIGISTGCNFHLFFTRLPREIRDDVHRVSRRFVRFGLREALKKIGIFKEYFLNQWAPPPLGTFRNKKVTFG